MTGGETPCVPELDASSVRCPSVAFENFGGDFATEVLKSCGIADNIAEVGIAVLNAGIEDVEAVKEKFFEFVCDKKSPPFAEEMACAQNLANMGLAFHACECEPDDAICKHIARPLYLALQPLTKECRDDGLVANTCAESACESVQADFTAYDEFCGTQTFVCEGIGPSRAPTAWPSKAPTGFPLPGGTKYPSRFPSSFPTGFPSTKYPTQFPTTGYPTRFPTVPAGQTEWPTKYPSRCTFTHFSSSMWDSLSA